ncbi:MAG: autoinducer synthase [Bradyrhizobium sp.]|nr:autoinducer synthase [Bradyrhizobium sp.]
MTYILTGGGGPRQDALLTEMFRERKRVFIDLLRWDVPVLAGEFELDQFDGPSAIYLLMASPEGRHCGSMRLLPTDGPTILGDIFPFLCDRPVPASPHCWEISRFCLSRDLRAAERRVVRDQLVTAAVAFALQNDITSYACVADMSWLSQIQTFGWRCDALGLPQRLPCGLTGAMQIQVAPDTPELMQKAGTWRPSSTAFTDQLAA